MLTPTPAGRTVGGSSAALAGTLSNNRSQARRSSMDAPLSKLIWNVQRLTYTRSAESAAGDRCLSPAFSCCRLWVKRLSTTLLSGTLLEWGLASSDARRIKEQHRATRHDRSGPDGREYGAAADEERPPVRRVRSESQERPAARGRGRDAGWLARRIRSQTDKAAGRLGHGAGRGPDREHRHQPGPILRSRRHDHRWR